MRKIVRFASYRPGPAPRPESLLARAFGEVLTAARDMRRLFEVDPRWTDPEWQAAFALAVKHTREASWRLQYLGAETPEAEGLIRQLSPALDRWQNGLSLAEYGVKYMSQRALDRAGVVMAEASKQVMTAEEWIVPAAVDGIRSER